VILSKARAGAPASAPPMYEEDTYAPATPTVPIGAQVVSRDVVDKLVGASSWLRLIVAYGFVVIVLMLGASFVVPIVGDLSGQSMGMALVYLLYSAIGLTMVLPLQRSLRGILELRHGRGSGGLETFVLEQTTFWRRAGVLTAISVVLMVLAIVLVVVGVVLTRMAGGG
jgi:hypothetical protein